MKRSHRHVSVILNEDVEHTGFKGELLEVRAGYFRNFLSPRKLADVATPKVRAEREKQIEEAKARREAEVKSRQDLATKLAAEPLKLKLKVGPGNQVFGSITASDVVKALKADHKLDITTQQLNGLPIKRLGRSQVFAKLGLGVVAQVPVEVSGEQIKKAKDDETDATKSKAKGKAVAA